MKRVLLLCIIVVIGTGCEQKEKMPLTGEGPVEATDFITFFTEKSFPLVVSDTSLKNKGADTALIANDVFIQFVPDSVLKKQFPKSTPQLYQIGRASEKGGETYLFLEAELGKKSVVYLICFDKNNRYLNAMPIVNTTEGNYTYRYGSLDKKFQITTYRERIQGGNKNYKKNVYIYNRASNEFTLILTEPNADIIQDIINPIDTLPQLHSYAGDYQIDKKNYISFRDGKNDSELMFFIHFEKDGGDCIGELKGSARLVDSKTASYKESGNPCALEFAFTNSSVKVKEVDGCGTYRDIRCFFDGTFPKKTTSSK